MPLSILAVSPPYTRFRPYSPVGDVPTHFEFEFSLGEEIYAYGFSFTPSAVHEEWLYLLNGSEETLVFERSPDGFRLNDVHFPKMDSVNRLTYMYDDLLPDQLYLSEANTRNIQNIEGSEVLTAPYGWFIHNLVVIFPSSRFHAWESIEQDEAFVWYWGYIEEIKKYLRVVVLEDRETVHDAFPDRRYKGERSK